MSYTRTPILSNAEWKAQRIKGLGSSAAPTIMGCNPYCTPYQLWRRLKGLDAPLAENKLMQMGHVLEPYVAQMFQEHTGHIIDADSVGDWLAIDNDKPFLRVSPDRTYDGCKGILECKTTQHSILEIPPYWFIQHQYQMGVMGIEHGALAWLSKGQDWDYKEFDADGEFYQKTIVPSLTEFWERYIIGDETPESLPSEASIRYPKAYAGEVINCTDEYMSAAMQIRELADKIKDLTEKQDVLKDKIKQFMGNAETLVDSDGTIIATWKNQKSKFVCDIEKFMADKPRLSKKYITEKDGARVLLIKKPSK